MTGRCEEDSLVVVVEDVGTRFLPTTSTHTRTPGKPPGDGRGRAQRSTRWRRQGGGGWWRCGAPVCDANHLVATHAARAVELKSGGRVPTRTRPRARSGASARKWLWKCVCRGRSPGSVNAASNFEIEIPLQPRRRRDEDGRWVALQSATQSGSFFVRDGAPLLVTPNRSSDPGTLQYFHRFPTCRLEPRDPCSKETFGKTA